jgi:hypothetical protein
MSTRLRNGLAILACNLITAAGMATGIALGCDGNYCNTSVNGCTPTYSSYQDSCCRDSGGGVMRCYTCWRDRYSCNGSPASGPAYSCSGPGAACS